MGMLLDSYYEMYCRGAMSQAVWLKFRKAFVNEMKNFKDENNTWRWFITHSNVPDEETVTSYYNTQASFEAGLEKNFHKMECFGEYYE